ncbi:sensor histidine kinase [Maribacter confluentis]|uniref:histidine kinase n=1 Tax=Maribacter confluentis TaxID=1656093 RepID=A0ABT8RQW2_9FLAO|nr:sensor histidine kinase [Maribacter confluentis]MDO1513293.1 sensor histidine kinase [Maribacter confluentis]
MSTNSFHYSILLLLFILPLVATSQFGNTSKIDSLRNELILVKTDTSKVNILSELSLVLSKIDSVGTFQTAFEALSLSQKIKYQRGEAAALFSIGGAYMDYFDLKKADEYLDKGLSIIEQIVQKDSSRTNLKLWLRGHYFKAVNYSYKGDVQKEVEMTDKVIPIAQKLNDMDFLTNVYTNIGILNMNLGQNTDAYNSFAKSNQINKTLASPKRTIFTDLMLSQLLYSMDSIQQMSPFLNEAKTLLDVDSNALDWHLYYTLEGLYHSGLDNYDQAISSLDKAKEIVMNQQMHQEFYTLLQRYALVSEKNNDYPAAVTYMTEYINMAKEKKKPTSIFQGLYKRSQYEAAQENYKNAYTDYVMAIDIYDSLGTAETLKNIKELELKYDAAENEKKILALTIINEKKKSQTYLLIGLASALAFLLFGGYYIYNQRLRKARKKEHLHESEMNLLKQEQQNKIFSAMIEGQEKERKRLAIDLHDGLGGRLSGISLNLSKLDKDEPIKYPKQELQKVMKDLSDSLTELRSIARNMMPETLVKFGLEAALKDYCSSMTGNETKVLLQFYGNEIGIDLNQQVTMYRVIQELINNAVKHAKASEVLVQYMREGNNVDITVEDNGIGFIKEISDEATTGMGLLNLRTRVAYLKGNLDFNSELNEGTTVNVHINIDAA